MNRRSALKSWVALSAATGFSQIALSTRSRQRAWPPPALGATDPKAASATLMVASVALGGDRCLAAVVPDGLVNLNTLGAHMGVAVPTSCEALADPAKFNQVKSLMREAERSGASSQFLVEETRVRRLGVPADLAALMRSGAASVSANYPAGVVTFS